jgi:hypothetical protein
MIIISCTIKHIYILVYRLYESYNILNTLNGIFAVILRIRF